MTGASAGAVLDAPAALRLRGVRKSFGPTAALRGVDLDVRAGSVHGLLGGNGSGKSTLIKVLAGVHTADAGTVSVRGQQRPASDTSPSWAAAAGLRFVHQDLGLFEDLSVAENLALGRDYAQARGGRISWPTVHARAAAALERFQVRAQPTQRLSELSQAERTLVAIARALQDQDTEAESLLILDEPTACLPGAEVERLMSQLQRYAADGQTIVLVSHRLAEIVSWADAASVLKDGTHVGSLDREQISEDALVALIAGSDFHAGAAHTPTTRPADPAAPALLSVHGLSSGVVQDVSFDVRPGQVLGIAGTLGSGRSTLLRALFGARRRTGDVTVADQPLLPGSVRAAMDAGLAYVPEDRARDAAFLDQSLCSNLSVADLSRYWQRLRLQHQREGEDSRADLSRFLVRAEGDGQLLSLLSGGNQQKVMLARWLRLQPRVVLLDEPTQGVDVRARAEIHGLVQQAASAGAAVLVVSSDFQELVALCSDVLVLHAGRVTGHVAAPGLTEENLTSLAIREVPATRSEANQ